MEGGSPTFCSFLLNNHSQLNSMIVTEAQALGAEQQGEGRGGGLGMGETSLQIQLSSSLTLPDCEGDAGPPYMCNASVHRAARERRNVWRFACPTLVSISKSAWK